MSLLPQLADVLTIAEVQSLADEKTFARGKAYFHEGAVSRLEQEEATVHAYVQGTHRYLVELGAGADGDLTYECNCPVGDDGIFCKHAVAVALSWLENSGEEVFRVDEAALAPTRRKRKTHEQLIHEYVSTLPEATLRDLVLEAVERDKALRDKLLFAARAANASDLPNMKTAVRQATRISRPLSWREAGAYGDRLMSLAAMLRQRLDSPHAAQVVELTELAIAGAEKSLEQIDDSGGDVMPAIQELVALHLEACTRIRPDPIKLADRLFRYQTEGVWDTYYNVLPAYAAPLGEAGIARYRERAQNEWNTLPALAIETDHRLAFDSHRMRLEQAMTSLAEHRRRCRCTHSHPIERPVKPLPLPAGGGTVRETCSIRRGPNLGESGAQLTGESLGPRAARFLHQRIFASSRVRACRRTCVAPFRIASERRGI